MLKDPKKKNQKQNVLKDKNKNFLVAIKKKEKENQEIEQYSRDNQLKTKHKINFF